MAPGPGEQRSPAGTSLWPTEHHTGYITQSVANTHTHIYRHAELVLDDRRAGRRERNGSCAHSCPNGWYRPVRVSALLRGPDADMLLHYVSLCFIWPCLVKRGGVGSWVGEGEDAVQMRGRASPAQTVAGQWPSRLPANCFFLLVRCKNITKQKPLVVVAVSLGLAACNTLPGSGSEKLCSGYTIGWRTAPSVTISLSIR